MALEMYRYFIAIMFVHKSSFPMTDASAVAGSQGSEDRQQQFDAVGAAGPFENSRKMRANRIDRHPQ